MESKFAAAKEMGADMCVNPDSCENGDVKPALLAQEKWGYDYTFDCTGIVQVMRTALEVAHRGWGESCVIGNNDPINKWQKRLKLIYFALLGVAAAGKEISTRPFQLVTGRQWKGTAFGGWKSRTEVPKLVQTVMRGEMTLDPYITHTYKGLKGVNDVRENTSSLLSFSFAQKKAILQICMLLKQF